MCVQTVRASELVKELVLWQVAMHNYDAINYDVMQNDVIMM